jgi:putative ABC transport system permease protein
LGVLKALGFSNELVLGVVLGESLAITLLGAVIGLLLSWAMVWALSQLSFMKTYFPMFFIPNRDLGLGIVYALALGLVAGILPAIQAMRLRLAVALRREG